MAEVAELLDASFRNTAPRRRIAELEAASAGRVGAAVEAATPRGQVGDDLAAPPFCWEALAMG